MRYAQFREEAARRPSCVADGGHRHLSRARDAFHRGRHRRDGNRHLGDDTQPLSGKGHVLVQGHGPFLKE